MNLIWLQSFSVWWAQCPAWPTNGNAGAGSQAIPAQDQGAQALLPPGLLPEYEKAGFIVFEDDAARMMRALSAITEISAGFDSIHRARQRMERPRRTRHAICPT